MKKEDQKPVEWQLGPISPASKLSQRRGYSTQCRPSIAYWRPIWTKIQTGLPLLGVRVAKPFRPNPIWPMATLSSRGRTQTWIWNNWDSIMWISWLREVIACCRRQDLISNFSAYYSPARSLSVNIPIWSEDFRGHMLAISTWDCLKGSSMILSMEISNNMMPSMASITQQWIKRAQRIWKTRRAKQQIRPSRHRLNLWLWIQSSSKLVISKAKKTLIRISSKSLKDVKRKREPSKSRKMSHKKFTKRFMASNLRGTQVFKQVETCPK